MLPELMVIVPLTLAIVREVDSTQVMNNATLAIPKINGNLTLDEKLMNPHTLYTTLTQTI